MDIKMMIRTIRLKWYFRKSFKPAGFENLCRHGNLLAVSRIMYEEQCEESCDYYLVGISGVKLGYPEKDEYFKKRVVKSIKGETTP